MERKRRLSKTLRRTESQDQTACEEIACASRVKKKARAEPAYNHMPDTPLHLHAFWGRLVVVVTGRAEGLSARRALSRVLKGLAATTRLRQKPEIAVVAI